ncbi:MAG TPA: rhomboid family intramembrane serine protease [Chryseosolibacter sp.]|nr:rhomboid family intramembrane serine protease [Chryseosolibacter sp.]
MRKIPFTLSLIFINVIVFGVVFYMADVREGTAWTITLLRFGAQFNPLSLDSQPYRVVTHMFLHGGIIHLVINMYVLLYAGLSMEPRVGTKKFAFVYVICGIAAAINGLYWSLFTVGVGASGAIMGVLGFALVYRIFLPGKNGLPMVILFVHIAAYALANILFPQWTFPDYASQFGGVITGIVIGFASFAAGKKMVGRVRIEYVMAGTLVILFFMLPRSQVHYFRFFRQVVAAEDTTRHLLKAKLTDDDMHTFIRNYHHWEDILARLNQQRGLPTGLETDTFKLRKYINLRQQENIFKKLVVQREIYTYLDSVEYLDSIMRQYTDLDYALWASVKMRPDVPDSSDSHLKVLYDSDGVETSGPAAYYRTGTRDSLGRWNGPVQDYYANGNPRMKGRYKDNVRDGVFLYYSPAKKYIEAGRYVDGKKFGKWQTFHGNGRLASEVFYNTGRFVHSVWDSLGNRLVVDGNGKVVEHFPNGVVAIEGEYHYGKKEGRWDGRYPDGHLRFEETFTDGKLVTGQSRSPDGKTFVYDESSLSPIPEGGFEKYRAYIKSRRAEVDPDELGHVRIAFNVSRNGVLSDIRIEQGASPLLDAKAKDILLNGPRWLPAREHGYKPVDSEASLLVEFY